MLPRRPQIALDILQALYRRGGARVSLQVLSEELGESISTVRPILGRLIQAGYVLQWPSGRYRIIAGAERVPLVRLLRDFGIPCLLNSLRPRDAAANRLINKLDAVASCTYLDELIA